MIALIELFVYVMVLMVRLSIPLLIAMAYLLVWGFIALLYVAGVLFFGLIAGAVWLVNAIQRRRQRKEIESAAFAERLAAWNAKLKVMDLRQARKRNLA
jgi:hypothetical protein